MNSKRALNRDRRLVRQIIISCAWAAIAALLTFPSGFAGHCGSGEGECTIYPVSAVGFPTTDLIWIPFCLGIGILSFVIIGWWRKFSNSPS
jgi:hypothetical protein